MKARMFRIDYINRISELESIEWIEDAKDKKEAYQLFFQRFGNHSIEKITSHWYELDTAE